MLPYQSSWQSITRVLLPIAKRQMELASEYTGLAGFEPSTYRLGGGRSILLSYSPSYRVIIASLDRVQSIYTHAAECEQ